MGCFYQEKKGRRCITRPGASLRKSKNVWNFAAIEDEIIDTYAEAKFGFDGTYVEIYNKKTGERLGISSDKLPYGIQDSGYLYEWEFKNYYMHKWLPFIMITQEGSEMPESGSYILDMIQHGVCKKVLYAAGFKQLHPCTWQISKDSGHVNLQIVCGDRIIYEIEQHWLDAQDAFWDFSSLIQTPHMFEGSKSLNPGDPEELPFA